MNADRGNTGFWGEKMKELKSTEPMDYEDDKLICTFRSQCGETINIPVHCEEPMTVVITN